MKCIPKKILFIKMRNIGDVLLSTPTYHVARGLFPGAEIGVVVNSGTEAMLTGNPDIDRLHVYCRGWKKLGFWKRFGQEIAFLRDIRAVGYEVAINLTEGDRGALLCWLSGAKLRIGVDARRKGFWGKGLLFHHRIDNIDSQKHSVQRNLDLLGPLMERAQRDTCPSRNDDNVNSPSRNSRAFTPLPSLSHKGRGKNRHRREIPGENDVAGRFVDSGSEPLRLVIPEHARSRVITLLKEKGWDGATPLVHIHPVSRWFYKCWVDESMAALIDVLEGFGAKQGIEERSSVSEPDLSVVRVCTQSQNSSSPARFSGRRGSQGEDARRRLRLLGMTGIVTLSTRPGLGSRGLRVVVTADSSEKERAKLKGILSLGKRRPIDLSGELNLKELGALSSLSKLFIGVDTAPMHIAAAVGTPVVALFGPSGVEHWRPWGVRHRAVTAPFFCGGRCPFPERCDPKGLRECMRQIRLEKVLEAVSELVAEPFLSP